MAISLQAAPTTNNTGATESTSATFSVTVASGSNSILVVCVSLESNGSGAGGVTSATFNGDALTEHIAINNSTWSIAEIWYRVAPDVGTFSLVVNWSLDHVITGAFVFDGVDQTTPFRTPQSTSGSSTSSSLTVTSVASDDYLIDCLCIDGGNHAVAPGANQTEHYEINVAGSSYCQGSASTQSGADGGVMSHTWTGSAPFTHVATAMIAAGGATGHPASRRFGGVRYQRGIWVF